MLIIDLKCFVVLSTFISTGCSSVRTNNGLPDDEIPMQGFLNGDNKKTNWKKVAHNELKWALNKKNNMNIAKNVIFFLGDGMGIPTTTASRVYKSQQQQSTGYDAYLAWDKFTDIGLAMTYNTDHLIADSAGTANAYLCGEKAQFEVICVNQHVKKGDCSTLEGNQLKSILEHAIDAGKDTGIVTTARMTHASPANAYAKSVRRTYETDADMPDEKRNNKDCGKDIALQLLENEYAQTIKVLMGGGRRKFMPNGTPDPEYPNDTSDKLGQRLDNRTIPQEWREQKLSFGLNEDQVKYVLNKKEFDKIDSEKVEYVLGLFEPDHMQYEVERKNKTGEWEEPSLTDMVTKAIQILQKGENGFFLFVEGARIDHAHHDNLAHKALIETVSMSDAVDQVLSMIDIEETLVIVTADHSHGFNMNGYAYIDADVTGLATGYNTPLMSDNKPYLILDYFSGPGYQKHRMDSEGNDIPRKNLTNDNVKDPNYVYDAAVFTDTAHHGGEEVAIYAKGPMSHLIQGTHEQHYIPYVIQYAACMGDFSQNCGNDRRNMANSSTSQSMLLCFVSLYAILMA